MKSVDIDVERLAEAEGLVDATIEQLTKSAVENLPMRMVWSTIIDPEYAKMLIAPEHPALAYLLARTLAEDARDYVQIFLASVVLKAEVDASTRGPGH